jgi:hypothetical protein
MKPGTELGVAGLSVFRRASQFLCKYRSRRCPSWTYHASHIRQVSALLIA